MPSKKPKPRFDLFAPEPPRIKEGKPLVEILAASDGLNLTSTVQGAPSSFSIANLSPAGKLERIYEEHVTIGAGRRCGCTMLEPNSHCQQGKNIFVTWRNQVEKDAKPSLQVCAECSGKFGAHRSSCTQSPSRRFCQECRKEMKKQPGVYLCSAECINKAYQREQDRLVKAAEDHAKQRREDAQGHEPKR